MRQTWGGLGYVLLTFDQSLQEFEVTQVTLFIRKVPHGLTGALIHVVLTLEPRLMEQPLSGT